MVMCLRRGGTFNLYFITNSLLSLQLKDFEKWSHLVKLWYHNCQIRIAISDFTAPTVRTNETRAVPHFSDRLTTFKQHPKHFCLQIFITISNVKINIPGGTNVVVR